MASTILRPTVGLVLLAACLSESEHEPASKQDAAGANAAPAPLREVTCTDQSVSQLMLMEEPSPNGVLSQQQMGPVFETVIDSSAGGMPHTQSFVYARFTPNGIEKVAIGDEDAFESDAWHIAFRRFLIRLNSGGSGPSSVTAARTTPGTTFDALASAPGEDELPYRSEQYFMGETCEYVADGSGLEAPGTALASFWSYRGCVHMTGNVFVIALPDGRHIKLQVLAYYKTENQQVCDETDAVPLPSGAGNLRLRWAYLD